jgi:ubiquinone/menaquinone biosynthesis C-methylase UbiE
MNDRGGLMETAEAALSELSGGHVLDVATGSGGFVTFLMENLKDYREITGIDSNERRLEAARKSHNLENVHFQLMDAAQMGFPDSQFDTVCIANSLHHMAGLPRVLTVMLRVCKPGGHIIISEMVRDGQSETQLTHVYLHHWWAVVDTAEGIIHNETFTRRQVIEIIEELDLHDLMYYDQKDLDSDPRDPELIRELDSIIDRYIQRIKDINGGAELCQRGEELRQRVHQVGFHGATTLQMIGEK